MSSRLTGIRVDATDARVGVGAGAGAGRARGGRSVRFQRRGGIFVRFLRRGGSFVRKLGCLSHGIATSAGMLHGIATSTPGLHETATSASASGSEALGEERRMAEYPLPAPPLKNVGGSQRRNRPSHLLFERPAVTLPSRWHFRAVSSPRWQFCAEIGVFVARDCHFGGNVARDCHLDAGATRNCHFGAGARTKLPLRRRGSHEIATSAPGLARNCHFGAGTPHHPRPGLRPCASGSPSAGPWGGRRPRPTRRPGS